MANPDTPCTRGPYDADTSPVSAICARAMTVGVEMSRRQGWARGRIHSIVDLMWAAILLGLLVYVVAPLVLRQVPGLSGLPISQRNRVVVLAARLDPGHLAHRRELSKKSNPGRTR